MMPTPRKKSTTVPPKRIAQDMTPDLLAFFPAAGSAFRRFLALAAAAAAGPKRWVNTTWSTWYKVVPHKKYP